MMDTRPAGAILFALAVHLTVAVLAGLVALTACAGVVDSMPLAWVVALTTAGAAGWRSATRPAFAAPCPRCRGRSGWPS